MIKYIQLIVISTSMPYPYGQRIPSLICLNLHRTNLLLSK
uniref:Uncharacterized protein n=1 Tax=Anguilla anguilla TaxID=7936 RepID=A0A0E9UMA6_ANGAN